MSHWTLAHPALLLVAPAAILLVFAAARRSIPPLPRWRRAISAVVRSAAVFLLVLSMVGLSATQRQRQPYLTVFLADVSESVPGDAWQKGIPEAITRTPSNERDPRLRWCRLMIPFPLLKATAQCIHAGRDGHQQGRCHGCKEMGEVC